MLNLNWIWILIIVIGIGSLVASLRIQRVYATGTIYIKSDGSIEPMGVPIVTYDNVTYTLTGNITSDEGVTGIMIERNYITLDGAGYTLQGAHAGQAVYGVLLNSVEGVTVRNLRVVFYRYGISVNGGKFNAVWENTLIANTQSGINVGGLNHTIFGNVINAANETGYFWGQVGISLFASKYNNITGNTVTGHTLYGIHLDWWDTQVIGSSNNLLRNNVMVSNEYNFAIDTGIPTDYVNDIDESNTVDGKPICYWVGQHDRTVPTDAGFVALVQCSGITVQGLSLSKNRDGILLVSTSDSTISGCTIAQTNYGIVVKWSGTITITENSIFVDYMGISLRESPNCMITQNTIILDEGKAEYNTLHGFNIAYCSNFTISENTMLFGYAHYQPRGFFFYGCNNATIMLNSIGDVKLFFQGANNMSFLRNNFLWCDFQFSGTNQNLTWDDGYPSGGNYWDAIWSDTDVFQGPYQNLTGSDGIWDHPFAVGGGFVDNYPLAYPTKPIPCNFNAGYSRSVDMTTTSRVTAFVFNATAAPPYARFNVTGLDGTDGSCEVVFPSDLLRGTFSVRLDDTPLTEGVDYTRSENGTHWAFDINYTHSTHTILIEGTEAIPELTAAATLMLVAAATFAIVVSARFKKRVLSKLCN